MTVVSLLIGCNLGAVAGALMVLSGHSAPNAFGIYMVMALCALLLSIRQAVVGRI